MFCRDILFIDSEIMNIINRISPTFLLKIIYIAIFMKAWQA